MLCYSNIYLNITFLKYLFIHMRVREKGESETDAWKLHNNQMARSRSWDPWSPSTWIQGPKDLFCCFPSNAIREPDWKGSIQNSTGTHTRQWQYKQCLRALLYNICLNNIASAIKLVIEGFPIMYILISSPILHW